MLKRRLIPKLQMKQSKAVSSHRMILVTTIKFEKYLEVGDPVSQAKIYEAQAADELIFLDIHASLDGRETAIDILKRRQKRFLCPLQ